MTDAAAMACSHWVVILSITRRLPEHANTFTFSCTCVAGRHTRCCNGKPFIGCLYHSLSLSLSQSPTKTSIPGGPAALAAGRLLTVNSQLRYHIQIMEMLPPGSAPWAGAHDMSHEPRRCCTFCRGSVSVADVELSQEQKATKLK